MNEKYNFVGIVQGLLNCGTNESTVVKSLVHDLRQFSLTKPDEKSLKNAVLKSAAFLTLTRRAPTNIQFERELLHEVSVAACHLFTRATLQTCIDCWSWMTSSRPEIEPLVVEEMLNAWQMSADLRLGMFAEYVAEPNPLAKEERDVLKPAPPVNADTHRVWIRYVQERLDIAKYKSDFETELFFNMLHKTLAFSVTERLEDSALNRHVSCVGLRFRFLNMALSIVQQQQNSANGNGSNPCNTIAKWILRERVYFTALDYFAARECRAPTQTSVELREDIKHLLEFWNKIVAEKKYLKEENFTLNLQQTVKLYSWFYCDFLNLLFNLITGYRLR